MWEMIKEWIDEYILLKYDPDRHALPKRETKRQTSGQTEYVNLAGHSLVGGQLWAPDMEDETKTAHAAWRQEDVRTGFGQRQEALTEEDIKELKDRGLSVKKAAVIKPYWANGFTRSEISSLLSRKGEKKVKGYSISTVAKIVAALSHTPSGGGDS